MSFIFFFDRFVEFGNVGFCSLVTSFCEVSNLANQIK